KYDSPRPRMLQFGLFGYCGHPDDHHRSRSSVAATPKKLQKRLYRGERPPRLYKWSNGTDRPVTLRMNRSTTVAASRSFLDVLKNALNIRQIYVLMAALFVLANARLFYGSLKMQTEHVDLWFHPDRFSAITR